ncbi:hypothetical protein N9955_00645 [bacterium]|nr:hypothetical protein [bacterium]
MKVEKAKIHAEWKEAKKKRDSLWKELDDPCDPNRRAKVKEWNQWFEREAELYNELTRPSDNCLVEKKD